MSNEKPQSLKATICGIAALDLLILWYFDWIAWAWYAALALALFAVCGWFLEALAHYRGSQEPRVDRASSQSSRRPRSDPDGGLMEQGLLLWQGHRRIRFAYRSSETGDSDREVTVRQVVSKRHGDGRIYFNGYCHARGEPRTFRIDRIKGTVTDTSTGEMATFRQLFDLSPR